MDFASSKEDFLKTIQEGIPEQALSYHVDYSIYAINPALTDSQVQEALTSIKKSANIILKTLLKDYIWQKEAFSLELKREDGLLLLQGQTRFGEAMADEWLIVYILRQLSRDFPDAWIRVYDTDGEFLLIEAAAYAEEVIDPEAADNRVWLHGGSLLIIKSEQSSVPGALVKPSGYEITVQDAIKMIRTDPSVAINSPMIEEEAFHRIRNFPSDISKLQHRARIRIPRKLAYILHYKPAYVSEGVAAFIARDPELLENLEKGDATVTEFPLLDLVDVIVQFNRVGYAQIFGQAFSTPKSWQAAFNDEAQKDPKASSALEHGMKLACGFEMLLSDSKQQDKHVVREIRLLLEDISLGEEVLPSDTEIKSWPAVEDSDEWLKIDLNELDKLLKGGDTAGGFGSRSTEEDLKKMTQRFQSFLNDEHGDLDEDEEFEEWSDDDDDDDDGEDKEVSFDENKFMHMMREMMGMPPEVAGTSSQDKAQLVNALTKLVELDQSSFDEDEEDDSLEDDLRDIQGRLAAELTARGALEPSLSLEMSPVTGVDIRGQNGKKSHTDHNVKGKNKVTDVSDQEDPGSDEDKSDVEIDFDLARSLLESLEGLRKQAK